MALVICGQLCSGKSTAAACLADDIETMDPKPTVGIIDESSFHLGRNQSDAGTRSLIISINSTVRHNVVSIWCA
ncbi:hypothetical protein BHM03_00056882 [Ensete ventricosum]|uniref:Uncharacterized protein n=1 Tax=Ensete ventricosum TaxID=4639 RepID=A0A426YJS6_ENSVE|nr:hypothetical protein B296_00050770 [Ensete ventricosum]RZS23875.1 hypothetical protein BHM03_00056882 [Ensete ventricosum]